MLEITSATTIPMLRKYAKEKNIDLGGATRRQDIIDIIEAAAAKPTGAADTPEASEGTANTPTEEESAAEGAETPAEDGEKEAAEEKPTEDGDGEAGDPEETKTDDPVETEQGDGKQPAIPEEKPPDGETKTDETAKVEQPTDGAGDKPAAAPPGDGVVIKRLLFASRALMKGEDVDAVHAALIEKGLHVGQDKEQGIYGARTAVAVRHFQVKNRLIVDGRVGKFTAQALGFTWEG